MAELCNTKNELIRAMQQAAEVYAKSVAELSNKIGVVSAGEYRLLSETAEAARKRSQKSHQDLQRHIAEHGCGEMMQSQAS